VYPQRFTGASLAHLTVLVSGVNTIIRTRGNITNNTGFVFPAPWGDTSLGGGIGKNTSNQLTTLGYGTMLSQPYDMWAEYTKL
jgi:hypothetical protein